MLHHVLKIHPCFENGNISSFLWLSSITFYICTHVLYAIIPQMTQNATNKQRKQTHRHTQQWLPEGKVMDGG